MPRIFAPTVCFMLNTCFPSESMEFWYVLAKRSLHGQPPKKLWGVESLMGFLGRNVTHGDAFLLLGSNVLCVIPYEKEKPEGSLRMDFSSLLLSLFPLMILLHVCWLLLCLWLLLSWSYQLKCLLTKISNFFDSACWHELLHTDPNSYSKGLPFPQEPWHHCTRPGGEDSSLLLRSSEPSGQVCGIGWEWQLQIFSARSSQCRLCLTNKLEFPAYR